MEFIQGLEASFGKLWFFRNVSLQRIDMRGAPQGEERQIAICPSPDIEYIGDYAQGFDEYRVETWQGKKLAKLKFLERKEGKLP